MRQYKSNFVRTAMQYAAVFIVPIRRSILQAPDRHHEHAIIAAANTTKLGELARFHLESWRDFTWRVGGFLLGELAVANMFLRYSANEKRNSCTFA